LKLFDNDGTLYWDLLNASVFSAKARVKFVARVEASFGHLSHYVFKDI